MKKLIVIPLSLIALVAVPLVIFDQFFVTDLTRDSGPLFSLLAKENFKNLELYKKDLETTGPKLTFLKSAYSNDAGEYLNSRIEWSYTNDLSSVVQTYFSKVASKERFLLTEDQKTILRNRNILEIDSKLTLFSQIDTGWLKSLRKYDYWDIDKNSLLDQFERFTLLSPLPVFDLDFSKAHILKAKDKGDLELKDALLDILHFGKLCLTTETITGEMAFIESLGIAKMIADNRPSLKVHLGSWAKLLDEKEKINNVLKGTWKFSRPVIGANVETMKEVFKSQQASTGICAAIREATQYDWLVWSSFAEARPETFSEYQKLIENHSGDCRLTWIRKKTPPWVKLPTDPESIYSSTIQDKNLDMFKTLGPFLNYMPNTKKTLGAFQLSTLPATF